MERFRVQSKVLYHRSNTVIKCPNSHDSGTCMCQLIEVPHQHQPEINILWSHKVIKLKYLT